MCQMYGLNKDLTLRARVEGSSHCPADSVWTSHRCQRVHNMLHNSQCHCCVSVWLVCCLCVLSTFMTCPVLSCCHYHSYSASHWCHTYFYTHTHMVKWQINLDTPCSSDKILSNCLSKQGLSLAISGPNIITPPPSSDCFIHNIEQKRRVRW